MTDFELYPVAMSVMSAIPLLLAMAVVTLTIAGVLPQPGTDDEAGES